MSAQESTIGTGSHGAVTNPVWQIWTGRVLSVLVALMMGFSASMKLTHAPAFIEQWVGRFGFSEASATGIGVVEIACAALYLIPQTAILGALLVTAYFGGAVATHVRVGDPFAIPIALGVIAWVGLVLRDPRLRTLVRR